MINKLESKYKNDKRISGGKLDICILCQTKKQLRLSHIVPKWAYKYLKSENGKHMINKYHTLKVRILSQDGTKKYLLCEKCEQFIGVSENYAKILMNGSKSEQEELDIFEQEDKFIKYNPKLIYRFVLSIMLKADFCNAAPFHKVNLPQFLINKIRNSILEETEFNPELLIIACRFYSKKHQNINPKGMIIHDHRIYREDSYFFSILLAGWEWIVFYNWKEEMEENHDNYIFKYFMSPNWPLTVRWGEIMDNRLLDSYLSAREKEIIEKG